jgi:LacI family transcriptional regulator
MHGEKADGASRGRQVVSSRRGASPGAKARLPRKAATLEDIARAAGVTKSTVSRALGGSTRISAETRERISALARRMHYEPNYLARNLTTRRTLSIGVVLEDIMNPFYTEVAKGIEVVLKQHGYVMLLTSSNCASEEELEITRTLLRNKVDGVLITPVSSDSEPIRMLRARGIPFFIMNERSDNPALNWVDCDNRAGGHLATEYMLKLGHRRFVCLRSTKLRGSRDRFEGFCKAIESYGLSLSDQVILEDAQTREEGRDLVDDLVGRVGTGALPSAMVAVNDAVAIGAMESLFAHGIRVPDDVSLIGYDDISLAGLIRVPLTTIHQEKYSMGQIAATSLLQMLRDGVGKKGTQVVTHPRLIIRQSCRETAS